MEKEKMRKRSLIIGILSFIILLLAGVGFWAYCLILAPDFEPRKTVYVYIDEKKDFDDLCRQFLNFFFLPRSSQAVNIFPAHIHIAKLIKKVSDSHMG